MAAKQTKEKPGYVGVKLARPAKGEPNFVTASVNGKCYKIKKGIRVSVPLAVAEVLANSEDAKFEADEFNEKVSQ